MYLASICFSALPQDKADIISQGKKLRLFLLVSKQTRCVFTRSPDEASAKHRTPIEKRRCIELCVCVCVSAHVFIWKGVVCVPNLLMCVAYTHVCTCIHVSNHVVFVKIPVLAPENFKWSSKLNPLCEYLNDANLNKYMQMTVIRQLGHIVFESKYTHFQ
jgi:hypothetical protein